MANEDHVYINLAEDGLVDFSAYPTITEKEIYEDRKLINARLHVTFENIHDAMEPFQKEWDADWVTALGNATADGMKAGANGWGDDFAEFFEKETWVEIGNDIADFADGALDAMADYAAEQYNDIVNAVNETYINLGKTIDDPTRIYAWVIKVYEEKKKQFSDFYDGIGESVEKAIEAAQDAAITSLKIYLHRKEIMDLPNHITEGKAKKVQTFVDTVLMDIDPELAKAIREDPNFYIILELINDHDSALAFVAYTGLIVRAIPPNFLAYIAGKCGAYVLIEIIMLIFTALLTVGTAVAARVSMLVARIAAGTRVVVQVSRKAKQIQKASKALQRALTDIERAVDDMHRLGEKLAVARQRDLKITGQSKTSLAAKRQAIKRDKKCQLCGKDHPTPRGQLGIVHYD